MKNFAIVLIFLSLSSITSAQHPLQTGSLNIFESLAQPDSVTQSTVIVHQDNRLELAMLGRSTNATHPTTRGFRVQVFSSNSSRTAKNDAVRIEKMIVNEFPETAVYVNYYSPFWKVRVGDFRTISEAQTFRNQIIETFPNLRSETYIVKEEINLPDKN